MKAKKLFFGILFIIICLVLCCILIYKKGDIIFQQEESNMTYNGIFYDTFPIKKTVPEAQKEINSILLQKPIKFSDNGFLLEDNETVDEIVSILQLTIGDIAIRVDSHSDMNGSSKFNRKLTQKRADTIVSYIKDRYRARFINAIGYGKEFPLPKDSNRTNNRIEIHLKRIYND